MKIRKIAAILLALCLIFMAGCGAAADSAETTAASAAAASAEETPAAEAAETAEPAAEAAPAEASAAEASAAEASAVEEEAAPELAVIEYPLCEETTELSLWCTACNFMGPLSSIQMDWEDFDFVKEMEELTNVHINYDAVSFETYQTQYNIYIAAGDYDDMMINMDASYSSGATGAYEDGVIIDLAPYLEEYAPDYYTFINSDDTLNGYAYSNDMVLRFIAAYSEPGVKNGNLARGDWMETFGIDSINTVDDLHDYLLQAKDAGCEVPVYMTSTCNDMMTSFDMRPYKVTGGDLSYYVVDGEIRTAIYTDEYRNYLSTMHQWYEEGLLYKDFATTTYDPHDNSLSQMIYNGQVAFWSSQLEGIDDYAASSPDENFVSYAVPQVTLDGGVNHCVEPEYIIEDSDIVITTACENVEVAVMWMNYWYTEQGIRMYNYGPEGLAYDLSDDGTVVIKDEYLNNEYGVDLSSILRTVCPYGSFTGVYLRSRLNDYASELSLNAAETWSADVDGSYFLPKGLSLTAEDNEEQSAMAADIMTYADTMIPKFINGDLDIDAEWDTYIAELENMGIQDCIAIEQAAYDAYVGA